MEIFPLLTVRKIDFPKNGPALSGVELQTAFATDVLLMMGDSTEQTMPPAIGYATSAADSAANKPVRVVVTIDGLAADLARTFRDRADVKIETGGGSVRVARISASGPDIAANLTDGRCTLSIGGWHDEMQSLDVAAAYIKMAVAGQLRVRVDRLGGKPWQIALERRLDDGSWQEESSIRFPRFNPFRRGKTTEYLQNT